MAADVFVPLLHHQPVQALGLAEWTKGYVRWFIVAAWGLARAVRWQCAGMAEGVGGECAGGLECLLKASVGTILDIGINMRFAISLIIALFFIATRGSEAADGQILACHFQESSSRLNRFDEVDQVRIDEAGNLIELRVARTIGTVEPVNWIFTSSKSVLGTDTFSIKNTSAGIVGAGVIGDAAHSFVLSSTGILTWVITQHGHPQWWSWRCRG